MGHKKLETGTKAFTRVCMYQLIVVGQAVNTIRCSAGVNRFSVSKSSSTMAIPLDDSRTKLCDVSGNRLGTLRSHAKGVSGVESRKLLHFVVALCNRYDSRGDSRLLLLRVGSYFDDFGYSMVNRRKCCLYVKL